MFRQRSTIEDYKPRIFVVLMGLVFIACSSTSSELNVMPDAETTIDGAPSTEDGGVVRPDGGPSDAGLVADADPVDAGEQDPITAAEEAAKADELPRPAGASQASSSMGHYHPARQASTFRAGPLGDSPRVQVVDFAAQFGTNFGTSPFHVVSTARYGREGVYTIWGATLTHAYRVLVDGDRFEGLDSFVINTFPASLPWNLVAFDDGRVVVSDSDGFRAGPADGPCATDVPTQLTLVDDNRIEGPIRCDHALALPADEVRRLCGVTGGLYVRGPTTVSQVITFDGRLATFAVFERQGVQSAYMLITDEQVTDIVACARVDDSTPSNEVLAESDGPATVLYVPTADAIVKMRWQDGTLLRVWERATGFRRRTGTTPTLVKASDGTRLAVTVDGRCAVTNVLNGLIVCDNDTSPSRLVAVRLDDELQGAQPVISVDLPSWIDTVENSPAARGNTVVVANYSGYLPNGLIVPAGGQVPEGGVSTWQTSPDSVADFATGIVALQWTGNTFEVLWSDPATQASAVPAISGGANRVYSTGSEVETGQTYLYGWRLLADDDGPAGERVMRVAVGDAPFRETTVSASGDVVFAFGDYDQQAGEFFDGGNNLLILDDRSIVTVGGRSIIRISDR